MHITIIGAGAAGLCAAKNINVQNNKKQTKNPINFDIYEQSDELGGTWVYTDRVGKDENGLNIHSSMYKHLILNGPKELSGFPDYPFPDNNCHSFCGSKQVLNYLNEYADHHSIRSKIKFKYIVIRVRPIGFQKTFQWEIIVKNLITNEYKMHFSDFIFVCNGHFGVPFIPEYEGQNLYKLGKQIHSHDYRDPMDYTNKKVLIIGSGPSALDIGDAIGKIGGGQVHISCHGSKITMKIIEQLFNHKNIRKDILRFNETSVEFLDNTIEEYDIILYCTGYKYSFPFLSVDCGICVIDNYVQPLYKQCVNIINPSMFFIGLQFSCLPLQMMDLQIKYCLAILNGKVILPNDEEMKSETENLMELRWANGYKQRHAHKLDKFQKEYYDDLAMSAGVEPIKKVVLDIYDETMKLIVNSWETFRDYQFKIIDDENFIVWPSKCVQSN